jgi:hypothetical protein
LPYIDTLSPEEKATVDRLIQEEVGSGHALGEFHVVHALLHLHVLQMKASGKRRADYLKELPPIDGPNFGVSKCDAAGSGL